MKTVKILLACLLAVSFVSPLAARAQSEAVTVTWAASPDVSVTGYNLYYGSETTRVTNKLSVGAALTATVPNLQAGVSYFFYATAQSSNGLESDPSNGLSYTPTVRPPDLAIDTVAYSPAPLKEGDRVGFRITVVNRGAALAPNTYVRLAVLVDGQTSAGWTWFTNGLAAGGSIVVRAGEGSLGSGTWRALAGTHTITFSVDSLKAVTEANEANNDFALRVTAAAAVATPSISVSLNKAVVGKSETAGVEVTVQSSTVSTTALPVSLRLDGSAKVGVDIAPLADTVIIPAGTNRVCFLVTPLQNGLTDGDKSVSLSLVTSTNYLIQMPASATLTITNAVTVADVDSDGDGMLDSIEALAGTNPQDAESNLKVLALTPGTDGQITLSWSSVPGIAYRVLSRNGLTEGQWSPVSEAIMATNSIESWTFSPTNQMAVYGISLEPKVSQ